MADSASTALATLTAPPTTRSGSLGAARGGALATLGGALPAGSLATASFMDQLGQSLAAANVVASNTLVPSAPGVLSDPATPSLPSAAATAAAQPAPAGSILPVSSLPASPLPASALPADPLAPSQATATPKTDANAKSAPASARPASKRSSGDEDTDELAPAAPRITADAVPVPAVALPVIAPTPVPMPAPTLNTDATKESVTTTAIPASAAIGPTAQPTEPVTNAGPTPGTVGLQPMPVTASAQPVAAAAAAPPAPAPADATPPAGPAAPADPSPGNTRVSAKSTATRRLAASDDVDDDDTEAASAALPGDAARATPQKTNPAAAGQTVLPLVSPPQGQATPTTSTPTPATTAAQPAAAIADRAPRSAAVDRAATNAADTEQARASAIPRSAEPTQAVTAPAEPVAAAPVSLHQIGAAASVDAGARLAGSTSSSSAQPSAASAAPPSPATQVAQAVVEPVKVMLAAPAHAAAATSPHVTTIQLTPDELGRVDIRIERLADGPTRIALTAERPETLSRLVGDQSLLQQALDGAGVPQTGRTLEFNLATPTPDATTSFASNFSGGGASNDQASNRSGHGGYGTHQFQRSDETATNLPTSVTSYRTGVDITA